MTALAGQQPPVLAVTGLTKAYGGVTAVDGVTLSVAPGESLGVIGPNGAGKTTFVGLVSGALTPSSGSVAVDGQDVSRLGAAARTRLGVGRTHQIPKPFGRMTVLENLLLAGRHARGSESLRATRLRCLDILGRTGLADAADAPAGKLPLLRRKRLELARALALKPRLLLLDEIGAGLVEHETAQLIELIRAVREEVAAVVLIEHVMDVITACCDQAVVLDFGKLILEGSVREVLSNPVVAELYLGSASSAQRPAPVARAAVDAGAPLLAVDDVHVSYGGVRALRGVSLRVDKGEVVALLGANGAGKTTLSRAISSAVRLDAGAITFDGQRIDGLRPDQVSDRRVAHCMEGRRIFSTLSVQENLVLGADRASKSECARRLAGVYDVFPALVPNRNKRGTAMSGGQQQMLAVGRALMADPSLLILDEVSLGLAPVAVDQLYEALEQVRATGVSILLVEQNLERGLWLADRGVVLAHGRVVLEGTPDELRAHPSLAALYVGESIAAELP